MKKEGSDIGSSSSASSVDPVLTAGSLSGDEHISEVLGGVEQKASEKEPVFHPVLEEPVSNDTMPYSGPAQVTPGQTYEV